MTHCGYCGAPTLNGSLCKRHWGELQQLLRRCDGLDSDLASAIGKRGRYGEDTGGGGAQPGLPINADAMEARRRLIDALCGAWRGLGVPGRPSSVDHAAVQILGRSRAVLACSVGPVLLGELVDLVPAAARATDRPRSRPGVRTVCPRCGQRAFLAAVMGALQCSACREQSTIAEVRAA